MAFANGSRIIAGHIQAEKNSDAYLGLERDVIGIEEATTLLALQHDSNRPEHVLKVDADEDDVGDDDGADALRHLVTTKAPTVVQRKLRGL